VPASDLPTRLRHAVATLHDAVHAHLDGRDPPMLPGDAYRLLLEVVWEIPGLEDPPDPAVVAYRDWYRLWDGWRRKAHALAARAPTGPGANHPNADTDLPWAGCPAWDELAPQTRRLLRYMHGREKAPVAELMEQVWEGADVSDGAIRVALSRANEFLQQRGHPEVLTKVRGEPFVRWA
jgi:hypothetical protein